MLRIAILIRRARGRCCRRIHDAAAHHVQSRDRILIGFARIRVIVDARIHDQDHATLHVIEYDQRIGDHDHAIGKLQIVRQILRNALVVAHRVVGHVADRTTEERRQLRVLHGTIARKQAPQRRDRRFRRFQLPAIAADDLLHLAAHAQHGRRVRPDEGVAPQLFPLLHRFQKECVFAGGIQLLENRDRRFQVCQQFAIYGHHIALGGQMLKLFKAGV